RAESNTKLVFLISHDLPLFRRKLAENGVEIGEVKSFDGINSLFCDGEDPEGNVFQIEQKLG
ncbi:MAG: VOC family protein, partial [Bacteroidota bacterium]